MFLKKKIFKTLKQSLFKYRHHFIQNKQCLLLCFCTGTYTLNSGFHRSWPAVAMAPDFPQLCELYSNLNSASLSSGCFFPFLARPFQLTPLCEHTHPPVAASLPVCIACQDSLWERGSAMCVLNKSLRCSSTCYLVTGGSFVGKVVY